MRAACEYERHREGIFVSVSPTKMSWDCECAVFNERTRADEPLQHTCEAQDCVAGELGSHRRRRASHVTGAA